MSAELLAQTLALMETHGSTYLAAQAAGVPRSTFQSRLQYARSVNPAAVTAKPLPPVDPMVREPLASFEDAWSQWERTIGLMRDRYAGPAKARKVNGRQKILVIPDLHAPFHNVEMFATMIARETDVDRAICIGDISDSYALSTFTQYRSVGFSEEWASVTATLQAMSEAFPSVELVIGNHDARLEKRLRERLTLDMVEAVKFMTGGLLCPVTALARRFSNVTVAKHIVPNGDSIDWFTTCGDAWLGHPEKYSRTPGAALRAVEDWLADHEDDLGLGRFRLIVMGHTHTWAQLPWRGRQMLIETGCLCETQGYMLKPKIGGRPQIQGYVTFEQVNGRTDLNSVRFHWLGAEAAA
jgi:predicted phosphodiesterase